MGVVNICCIKQGRTSVEYISMRVRISADFIKRNNYIFFVAKLLVTIMEWLLARSVKLMQMSNITRCTQAMNDCLLKLSLINLLNNIRFLSPSLNKSIILIFKKNRLFTDQQPEQPTFKPCKILVNKLPNKYNKISLERDIHSSSITPCFSTPKKRQITLLYLFLEEYFLFWCY